MRGETERIIEGVVMRVVEEGGGGDNSEAEMNSL